MKTIKLRILVPIGTYLESEISFLEVQTEDYLLGILPNHAPLIAKVSISHMHIRQNENDFYYAVGGGVIDVKENEILLLLNSIERDDEIDLERAIASKKRAEDRLKLTEDNSIDKDRAKSSLNRANNRIKLANKRKADDRR